MATISWVLCPCVCSLPALLLARAELTAIERGESAPEGRRLTQVALWMAIGNCVVYALFFTAYVLLYSVGFVVR